MTPLFRSIAGASAVVERCRDASVGEVHHHAQGRVLEVVAMVHALPRLLLEPRV
jgi:hypothetical protein